MSISQDIKERTLLISYEMNKNDEKENLKQSINALKL